MTDVAVALVRWRKSSRSNGGNGNTCVESGILHDSNVATRDSKHPVGGVLTTNHTEWRGFITVIASGAFDR